MNGTSKLPENVYLLAITENCVIDLATISDHDWKLIKKDVKLIMEAGETREVGKAYIAAFIIYMQGVGILSDDFDPKTDMRM